MLPDDCWLVTERLALRRMTHDDLDWLATLYSDEEVTRYLGGLKTRDQVEDMLRTRVIEYYDTHPGLGMWMTVERASGQGVGFHLINNIQGETIIQIGYGLAKSAWGRGYATEMASALMRYAFEDLKLPRIAGMASLPNVASQRVLEKIGLERRGERSFPHPAYAAGGPLAWFEREADAWLAERQPPTGGSFA
ncbi:MAG: GNAT family N-acetyltransferase [Acidobacteria bacterium]|jgi:RimJ/RimL family protein N-acetyltransferase|nr:GNAT family N-acetyltransferase [Acidobacteriota bacterium]